MVFLGSKVTDDGWYCEVISGWSGGVRKEGYSAEVEVTRMSLRRAIYFGEAGLRATRLSHKWNILIYHNWIMLISVCGHWWLWGIVTTPWQTNNIAAIGVLAAEIGWQSTQ